MCQRIDTSHQHGVSSLDFQHHKSVNVTIVSTLCNDWTEGMPLRKDSLNVHHLFDSLCLVQKEKRPNHTRNSHISSSLNVNEWKSFGSFSTDVNVELILRSVRMRTFSLPTHRTWQLGQWPFTSNCRRPFMWFLDTAVQQNDLICCCSQVERVSKLRPLFLSLWILSFYPTVRYITNRRRWNENNFSSSASTLIFGLTLTEDRRPLSASWSNLFSGKRSLSRWHFHRWAAR